MEKNIVDANWGLNGEDEKCLWEDWKVKTRLWTSIYSE